MPTYFEHGWKRLPALPRATCSGGWNWLQHAVSTGAGNGYLLFVQIRFNTVNTDFGTKGTNQFTCCTPEYTFPYVLAPSCIDACNYRIVQNIGRGGYRSTSHLEADKSTKTYFRHKAFFSLLQTCPNSRPKTSAHHRPHVYHGTLPGGSLVRAVAALV